MDTRVFLDGSVFASDATSELTVLIENNQGKGESMSSTMGQTGFGTGQVGQGQGRSQAAQHTEGTVARSIEQQTAKIPSDVFLWAALGSIGTSAILRLMGKKNARLFIGDWVAPFMLFGVYNKIVKTQGSDRLSH